MGYGRVARVRTVAQMSQCLRSFVLSHSAERLTLQIPTGKRLQDAGIAIDSRARRVTDEVQWEPPI
jgi:hypothetical protein